MTTETGRETNRLEGIGGETPIAADFRDAGPSSTVVPAASADTTLLCALNWAEAVRRVDGDHELLAEMAGLFLSGYPDQFAKIAEAIDNRDAGSLEIHAHTLKGTARVFCAEGVIAAAASLERLGETKEWEPAVDCLEVLRRELSRMRPALEPKARAASGT